ncbi:MAG: glycoside hydrolase family 3 C-terminal domain-containing protein, partial [Alicyclobacillus sp.]|nr:glycoside hydrolase family 3 C-terminal domain-containing protein [Alicyclobacillus sp.]
YPCHIESLLEQSEDNVFQTPLPSGVKHVDEFIPMRTILEAIRHRVGAEAQVVYAKGCDILGGEDAELDEAVALAARADVAVVVVGDRAGLTDACTTGESRDRATLSLIGRQEELVRRVMATGTKTVVVLVSGRPLAIPDIAERANAVLEAWLPGEEGAEAVAAVLFGDVNPSGKLPITIPRSVGQVPIYYGHKPSGGRSHWKGTYVDESNLPLYPFGHGLSYTEFTYRDLVLSPRVLDVHGEVEVSCVIENVGARSGEEVVQLYARDVAADVTRPVKALCGFARVSLAPGEKARVRFRVSAHQFGFYNREMRYVVEPGEIEFMVGASSEDIRLRGMVRMDGVMTEIEREKTFCTAVAVEHI